MKGMTECQSKTRSPKTILKRPSGTPKVTPKEKKLASGSRTPENTNTRDSVWSHGCRIRCHPDLKQKLKMRIREERWKQTSWSNTAWSRVMQKIRNEGWGLCVHGGARSPRGGASASRDRTDDIGGMADMESMETPASGGAKADKADGSNIQDLGYRLLGSKMGSGTFGVVYPVLWKHGPSEAGGELAVVKHITHSNPQHGPSSVEDREIQILRSMSHAHVIRMLQVITTPFSRDIIFEHCKCDLRTAMQPPMDRQLEPVKVTWQICSGLAYVHDRQVMHRDLKPQNIFVQEHQGSLIVKIGDFGSARWVTLATGGEHEPSQQPARTAPLTPNVTTLWYSAPEVLLAYNSYDTRVDMWALGCICVELESKQVAFPASSEHSVLTRIFNTIGIEPLASGSATWKTLMSLPAFTTFRARFKRDRSLDYSKSWKLSPHALAFVTRLLTPCPSDRMCAKEALEHDFFTRETGTKPLLVPPAT